MPLICVGFHHSTSWPLTFIEKALLPLCGATATTVSVARSLISTRSGVDVTVYRAAARASDITKASAMTALSLQLLSLHDEAMRRVSDVHKRIAGDEREADARNGIEHPHIARIHDKCLQHAVLKPAVRGRQIDFVTVPDVFEGSEQPVAVRGKRAVARRPWQRGVRQVADGKVEHGVVVAGFHRGREMQTRNLETTDEAVGQRDVADAPQGSL